MCPCLLKLFDATLLWFLHILQTCNIDFGCCHIGVCVTFFTGIYFDNIDWCDSNIVTYAFLRIWRRKFIMELYALSLTLKMKFALNKTDGRCSTFICIVTCSIFFDK